MLASEGVINSHSIRTGQLTDEEWQKYTIATANLANASIYIDDTPGIRITEIRSRARKLAQETGNLGLILIDYLQLITGTGRENRQQEVSEISRQLKILAKELKVPAYVVFQDASLQDMASVYPVSMEELQNITGVGKSKAEKYGAPFIALIKEYVEENDIERPEDIRIRTVPNKSKLKVSIVQHIDRKVSLEDIANSNNMDFSDLLSEIESIVYSGTKININYFIDDVMDSDDVDEIFDYFRHSPTDDLDTAMSALEVYEEDEVRLIRIKFISELAN